MIELSDIVKREKIITVSPDTLLSNALAKLSTSHDAAFIFDEKDRYLGVINPYYALVKSSHPGNTKVMHCLYHAPKIYINFPVPKVARLLIESKIHYLPVFNKQEEFQGIISARRILTNLRSMPAFKKTIGDALNLKRKPLVAVYEDDTVAHAIKLFKSTRLSKLIVINRDMKLKGILTYYDLISFMTAPKKHEGKNDRVGRKSHLFNQHVKNYMKPYVITLKKENSLSDAFHLIIEKRIGSVVIVDSERHPVGLVTTRDLLRFYMDQEAFGFVKKTFSKIGKLLSNRQT